MCLKVRDEVDEREAQAQLFSLLGGGRERPDCLIDLAELDTADMQQQDDQQEDPRLMADLEQVPPLHR